jgi:hypothetical protein
LTSGANISSICKLKNGGSIISQSVSGTNVDMEKTYFPFFGATHPDFFWFLRGQIKCGFSPRVEPYMALVIYTILSGIQNIINFFYTSTTK